MTKLSEPSPRIGTDVEILAQGILWVAIGSLCRSCIEIFHQK